MTIKTTELPSQSELKEYFDYDPKTGSLTWKKLTKGSKAKLGAEAGTLFKGYRRLKFKTIKLLVHRIIYKWMTGIDPEQLDIDHKNGDRSDNRWCNLRAATRSQNIINTPQIKNKPLPKGVFKAVDSARWIAVITIGNVRHYLGCFKSPELAGQAYADAAERLHGEWRHAN